MSGKQRLFLGNRKDEGMKARFTILAVVLAASLAMAQAKTQAGSQNQPATGQSGAPSAPAASAQASQPAPGPKHVLQPKSQEEYKAYQDAYAKTDAAEMAAAAEAFAAKFPNSELRELLYVRATELYQQNNNTEQEVAMGRKAIALDPTDPLPLIHVASALAETTRDTDLDREDRLKEAAKDAQAAINNIDTGLQISANTPPDTVAMAKTNITAMAYETLGMVGLNEKDYAAAEQNLLKAVDVRKASPDPVVYLRLSVAQDHLGKYPQALESVNKALDFAQPGSMTQNLAKQQQARLQKLIPATPAAAPAPAKPATTQPSSATPATPPH